MSINKKIRLIREAKGLTQEQIAEKLGISSSVYGDIERGENDPKLSKLARLAEIFEMQLSELVDLTEKGTLNINCNNEGKNVMYVGSVFLEKEMALKDKEIELQQREIELLKKLLAHQQSL